MQERYTYTRTPSVCINQKLMPLWQYARVVADEHANLTDKRVQPLVDVAQVKFNQNQPDQLT